MDSRYDELYDTLSEPLHVELYNRQTFDFLDELSDGQQLLLEYDYLRTQMAQGGFIQFIQNGYVALMPPVIEHLTHIGATAMAKVIDDALKVYVLNINALSKTTTVEEFAKLYEEFKEFEILDQLFQKLNLQTEKLMLDYAAGHLDEFVL